MRESFCSSLGLISGDEATEMEQVKCLPSASVASSPWRSLPPRSAHPRDALIDSPTAAECAAAPAIRRHAPTDERASKAPPLSRCHCEIV